jgi:hypothetical protein
MRREFLKLVGLGTVSVMLPGCLGNTVYTYRQKLTVIVGTPEGERSGSAVTEVKAAVGSQGLSGANVGYSVRGEATVVELGLGKYLFALLSNGGEYPATEYWAMNAFYKRVSEQYPSGNEELMHKFYSALQTMREPARLTPDLYPLLVTFTDINDPKSVKQLKPGKFRDVLGTGYSLRSISLEIVDEEATEGQVRKKLGFADEENPIFVDWKKFPSDHPLRSINIGSFRTG